MFEDEQLGLLPIAVALHIHSQVSLKNVLDYGLNNLYVCYELSQLYCLCLNLEGIIIH